MSKLDAFILGIVFGITLRLVLMVFLGVDDTPILLLFCKTVAKGFHDASGRWFKRARTRR